MSTTEIDPLTREETIATLAGPRIIPRTIASSIDSDLKAGRPIVNMDRFCEFLSTLMHSRNLSTRQTFEYMVTLASSSRQMALLQAGDVRIPRPRRLHEHDQSVLNTYNRVFASQYTDPRDVVLWPMFSFQDGGKSLCVALTGNSRQQDTYNGRTARGTLEKVPRSILTPDAKKVIYLTIGFTGLGVALRAHAEKGVPLDKAVEPVKQQIAQIRRAWPGAYADRMEDYLLVSYLADAGAHTQHARFIDAKTGRERADVRASDRFGPDGEDRLATLDRLFSDKAGHRGNLTLFVPEHLAVMRAVFPARYA